MSARRHPQRAVEPDHLAVEHLVLDDVDGERGELVGPAEPARERDRVAERLARLLRAAPPSSGVSNVPGAIVHTRMPPRARSRAAGSVMPTIAPFDAE